MKKPASSHCQSGFSLIEILVSVVVLSLGLLGAVGMQLSALQGNRDAQLQASAVRFARELSEAMRGNQTVASKPTAADNPYLMDVADPTAAPARTLSNADCYSNICATAPAASQNKSVAASDANDWLRRIYDERDGLPGAKVLVCFDKAPYDAGGLPRWACTNSGTVAYIKIGWSSRSLNKTADGTAGNETVLLAVNSRPGLIQPVIPGIQGL